MEALAFSISLELALWLGYSGIIGCLTIFILRRRRRNGRRYDVVSTSTSSGDTGEVEMEDRSSHSVAQCVAFNHVTSPGNLDKNAEGEEEEESEKEKPKSKRWWKKKERLGSKRYLVSKKRLSSEEFGGISSQVENPSTVILTKHSSPANEQLQSNDIPTTISIPYDIGAEDIPFVDEVDDEDYFIEDGGGGGGGVSDYQSKNNISASTDALPFSSPTKSRNLSVSNHSSPTSTPSNPPVKALTPSPSPSKSKVPSSLHIPPARRNLAALHRLSHRHPKVTKNSTKCASVLLFLLLGYFLTVITAIVVYRSLEFFILYSDAIQCRNISYSGIISTTTVSSPLNDAPATKYTDEELENCQYYLNDSSPIAFEDVFVRVAMDRNPFRREPEVTLHGWWIPASPSGNFSSSNLTLLYTHGNADNISFFKKLYEFLAFELGIGVFAWDFPGFGKSGGEASESSIRIAAEGVMEYLVEKRGIPPKDVVLWGYSLGGSVAADLASKYPDVRGVIMQAPIDSAADVVASFLPLTGWSLAKILTQKFETKSRIKSLRSCLLQFVGDEDEMFPISRERALFSRATRAKADCKKFFTVGGLSHLEDPTENMDFRRNIVDYFNENI